MVDNLTGGAGFHSKNHNLAEFEALPKSAHNAEKSWIKERMFRRKLAGKIQLRAIIKPILSILTDTRVTQIVHHARILPSVCRAERKSGAKKAMTLSAKFACIG